MTDSELSATTWHDSRRRQTTGPPRLCKPMVRPVAHRLCPVMLFVATVFTISTAGGQLPLRVAELQRTDAVDFGREILPLLRRNCLACHHAKEPEAGLVLESHRSLLKGGDSGQTVVPRDPAASLLMARVTGTEEPLMPPEDNAVAARPLTAEELGLLKLWIEQGAASGADSRQTSIAWQPLAETINPINAIATSPDGQFAACGRGNRVTIHDLDTGKQVARLADPRLAGEKAGVAAALDVVQSIAFSPDGERIATGGFRSVKLWRRVNRPLPLRDTPLMNAAGLVAATRDASRLAIVNAVRDIEIWDVTQNHHLHTLRGHADPVIGLNWINEAHRIISGDASGKLIAWDSQAGRELATAQSRRNLLPSFAVSPDGTWVAAVDADRHVGLWRFKVQETGSPGPLQFDLEATEIDVVAKITDASSVAMIAAPVPVLAIGTQSGAVMLIGLNGGTLVRKVDHGGPVDAVAISPDGSELVAAGRDGRICSWQIATGEIVRTFGTEPRASHRVAIAKRDLARQHSWLARLTARAAETEKLAATEAEALAQVTEARDKAAAQLAAEKKKREQAVTARANTEEELAEARQAAEDVQRAAAAAKKRAAELESKKLALAAVLEKHTTARAALAEQLAAEEERVARAAAEVAAAEASIAQTRQEIEVAAKMAAIATANAENLAANLQSQQKAIAAAEQAAAKSEVDLANRQQALATARAAAERAAAAVPAQQEAIELETRRGGDLQRRFAAAQQRLAAAQSPVVSMAYGPDGYWLATAHANGTVRAYRSSAGSVWAVFEGDGDAGNRLVVMANQKLCLCGVDRSPTVWSLAPHWHHDLTIGTPEDSPISDRVTALDFRPDGLAFAAGSGPPSRVGEVKLFSVNGGHLVRDFGEVHSDTVLAVSFSPNGRLLASAAADKTIRVLDVAEARLIRSLEGHTHHVLSIAWQDDGQALASASADNQVKIWDTDTGEQKRTIGGFPKEVTDVAFVARTSQVVTACADGLVRLYDAADEKLVRTFDASGDFLFALAVTPDGTKLLAGGHSGVLRVWSLADGKVLYNCGNAPANE